MHFNTVNKYLKDIRLAQRMLRDLGEAAERTMPEVTEQTAVVDKELGNLLDTLLKVDYDK